MQETHDYMCRGIYSKVNKGKGETISGVIGNNKSSIFIGKFLMCFINQSTSNQNWCSTYFGENWRMWKNLVIYLFLIIS